MTHKWRSLAAGALAAVLAGPTALADDCVETVSRVPMVRPAGAGPGGAQRRMARLGAPVPPPRLAMARVGKPKADRAARAQARKAHRPKAAAHRAAGPARQRLAKRPAPVRLAA